MNEQERSSQVSALFDGELDAAQADLVARRLLKDPGLRASWDRYALIGAGLRGDPLALGRAGRGDVASRVRLALEREAPLSVAAGAGVPDPAQGTDPAWRRVALGSALAAGVALMAILVMRGQAPSQSGLVAAVTQAPLEPVVLSSGAELKPQDAPAPGYTTPLDARPVPGVRSQTPLVNYVVAHSEYTTPVVRLSPLSAVISGNFDPTENTVEMTEAEVGARR
jgi:negative regulator of sigma E activity